MKKLPNQKINKVNAGPKRNNLITIRVKISAKHKQELFLHIGNSQYVHARNHYNVIVKVLVGHKSSKKHAFLNEAYQSDNKIKTIS